MSKQHFYRRGAAPCEAPIRYRAAGVDGIYLCNGFEREEVEGEWYTRIEDIEGLHVAIASHLVAHKKELAPKELRFIRLTMDKTQSEIARMMGVDSQTVARWEKGESRIPGPADRMLRIKFLASVISAEEFQEYVSEQPDKLQDLASQADQSVTFVRDPNDASWKEDAHSRVLEDA